VTRGWGDELAGCWLGDTGHSHSHAPGFLNCSETLKEKDLSSILCMEFGHRLQMAGVVLVNASPAGWGRRTCSWRPFFFVWDGME
jgi:hypothetical protein